MELDDEDDEEDEELASEGDVTVGEGASVVVLDVVESSVEGLEPSVVTEPVIGLSVGTGMDAVSGAPVVGEDPEEEEEPGAEILVMANWGLVLPESPNTTL